MQRVSVPLQELVRGDKAIEGKHLARFLRLVGMERARMVLLVAGGVDFDTADAAAHGLSAVLRKPFTKIGFCNILRGMFFCCEAVPPPVPPPLEASFGGPHLCLTKRLREPEGDPLAAAAVAAAVHGTGPGSSALGGAGVMHVGRLPALTRTPSYPACLGFTPFHPLPHPMIGAYPLGTGFLLPGQPQAGPQAGPQVGPQRKYTKIAPKEPGGPVDSPAPPVEGNARVVHSAAETSSVAVAACRAGEQDVSPGSAGPDGLGMDQGVGSGDIKIAPRGGDDSASSAAPELPLLPASSVDGDDVLSGEHTSAMESTAAAAAEPPVLPTPEAP